MTDRLITIGIDFGGVLSINDCMFYVNTKPALFSVLAENNCSDSSHRNKAIDMRGAKEAIIELQLVLHRI